MARPASLSGFPEWLPGQRAVEQHLVDVLRRTFELHGFAGIETRAVEPLAQLLRKGEIDKEVYVLGRLQADRAADAETGRELALHYDLTVPFARYVVENAGDLEFPFRRYQIQKAWRGERPQEGRYREFLQADIDIVDVGELSGHHEVELVEVLADVFARLPLPPVRVQVNNRRLVQGFCEGLGIGGDIRGGPGSDLGVAGGPGAEDGPGAEGGPGAEAGDVTAVLSALDKLDKLGVPAVRGLLVERSGLTAAQADACVGLAAISGADASVIDRVQALGVTSPLLDAGLQELAILLERAAVVSRTGFAVVADLSIARGLDYYTGTVYETRMVGFEHLGSICSGGRYDALASDGRTTYPGVGLSLGVTRVVGPLLSRGLLTSSRPVPTCVLVVLPDDASRQACAEVAGRLRERGVPCEVAPRPVKYGKQIRYAQRRGIPYVWFPPIASQDGSSSVRDIRSGEQLPADPASWTPPDADRWPVVRSVAVASEQDADHTPPEAR
ncbi:MAG: histidine--tRNA ligase [Angustibacter sp.]